MKQFREHYARDERAMALQGRVVVVLGGGATGSLAGASLVHSGVDALFVDRDRLEPANLLRHYLRDPLLVGQQKATALANKLQSEVPALQRVRGLVADLEVLSWEEYRAIVRGASLLVGATAQPHVDRVLDLLAREMGIPFIAPSLWAGEHAVLGDLFVSAWNLRQRRGACYACLRPPEPTPPMAAEAQPGLEVDVQRVAALTAQVAIELLLAQPDRQSALRQQLERGANYFLIPRWPPTPRSVVTRSRRGCAICATAQRSRETSPTFHVGQLTVGAALGSVVLWHQLIPGLDAAATIALVTAAGLWWRGRLPSYAAVAAAVRRLWRGRE